MIYKIQIKTRGKRTITRFERVAHTDARVTKFGKLKIAVVDFDTDIDWLDFVDLDSELMQSIITKCKKDLDRRS
jgi:hypothetical protein